MNRNPERERKKHQDGHRGRVRESEGEAKLTITGLGVQVEQAGKLYDYICCEEGEMPMRRGCGREQISAIYLNIFPHGKPIGSAVPCPLQTAAASIIAAIRTHTV